MDKRPNLMFVFADQLGYTNCGYGGDEKAITPNIDRLASESVNFVQAVSNMPVCSAYRASLLTGMYTTSTGMVINELRMRTDLRCLGHVLTEGGYETGYIGKWHLYANELGNHDDPKNSYTPPGPDRLGFDGYWAAYGFRHTYYNATYHTNSPDKIYYGEGVYEPDGKTELMIDWLRYVPKGPEDKPFAAFLSYGVPHGPFDDDNVPPAYRALFQDVDFPDPPNAKPETDPYADAWGRLTEEERADLPHARRNHHAMAANLDWNLGRLLQAIDELGLGENTIVVFTSDHGDMMGAQGLKNKNTFYEEAARIPFLVRRPGNARAGRVSDACLSTVDMMPTMLALLGLPIPESVEGMDLSHCVRGEAGPEPEAAFMQNTGACAAWEDGHEWRALRDQQYTYAIYRVDRSERLFDHLHDPYQMVDLAGDPAHQAVLDRFRRMLADKMRSLNDTFEASSYYRDHWIEDRIILRAARDQQPARNGPPPTRVGLDGHSARKDPACPPSPTSSFSSSPPSTATG